MADYLQTVTGPVASGEAGLTLPHEHVMVDFIGAENTGPHRYDRPKVVERVLPRLREITALGVRTFIECTPMYLARDVRLLKALSEMTGLNFVTNTGQYKEPFLPAATFVSDPEAIAEGWIAEFRDGIDATECRPGFIKTAVQPESLAPVQRTLIAAAAITSRETGLPIATHTGVAVAAAEILDILEQYAIPADRWIFVHAQNEPDMDALVDIARRGAWIELDGLRPESAEKHLTSLQALLDAGFEDRVLLSHDSGWYRVGEPDGGIINGYTYLFDGFIPLMRKEGVPDELIHRICAVHPGLAFSVRT